MTLAHTFFTIMWLSADYMDLLSSFVLPKKAKGPCFQGNWVCCTYCVQIQGVFWFGVFRHLGGTSGFINKARLFLLYMLVKQETNLTEN